MDNTSTDSTREMMRRLQSEFSFLNPKNLRFRKIFAAQSDAVCLPNIKDIAVLVVDVQKRFCDPKCPKVYQDPDDGIRGTKTTSKKAGKIKSLIAVFRKAGISIYNIATAHEGIEKTKKIDFHKFKPDSGDAIILKKTNSAFDQTKLDQWLRQNGKKHLLVCGFNLSACVYATVADAIENKYNVSLMLDLSGNDKTCDEGTKWLREMRKQGARIVLSSSVLEKLKGP